MNVRPLWLALLIPACLFPDVTDLGGTADGPNDKTDANPPDSGSEGGSETGSDAGWCASQDAGYRFCADFDESAMASQGFDLEAQVGQGGQFQITTSTFVSSPQSAVGIASPFAAGQTAGDRLIKSLWALGSTPTTLTCTCQWDPVALSTTPNDYAHVIAFELYSDAAATQQIAYFGLNLNATGELDLLEIHGNTATAHIVTSGIPTGSWLAVTLSLLPGQGYSATVGTKNATGILASPVPTTSHGTVEVGPAYFAATTTASSPGWTFGYDNVICF